MQIPAKLKYVNIFFDTPTFDRITKDKSAKESTQVQYSKLMLFNNADAIFYQLFLCKF